MATIETRRLALGALLATVSAVLGCGRAQDDTVAIRQAIFESAGSRTIYIREHVAAFDDEFVSPEDRILYSGFEIESREEPLKASDFGNLSVHIVPESEQKALFAKGCERGWRQFHARYPDALTLFELSAIGFRAGHSEAVIYIASGSACLAARGDIILLKKESGKWVVTKTLHLLVS